MKSSVKECFSALTCWGAVCLNLCKQSQAKKMLQLTYNKINENVWLQIQTHSLCGNHLKTFVKFLSVVFKALEDRTLRRATGCGLRHEPSLTQMIL